MIVPFVNLRIITRACLQVGRNICHGSDSVENAEKEIALWFGDAEVVDHESAMKDWIYE